MQLKIILRRVATLSLFSNKNKSFTMALKRKEIFSNPLYEACLKNRNYTLFVSLHNTHESIAIIIETYNFLQRLLEKFISKFLVTKLCLILIIVTANSSIKLAAENIVKLFLPMQI